MSAALYLRWFAGVRTEVSRPSSSQRMRVRGVTPNRRAASIGEIHVMWLVLSSSMDGTLCLTRHNVSSDTKHIAQMSGNVLPLAL